MECPLFQNQRNYSQTASDTRLPIANRVDCNQSHITNGMVIDEMRWDERDFHVYDPCSFLRNLNVDSNPDLCSAGAVLYLLGYQANWELVVMQVDDNAEEDGYTSTIYLTIRPVALSDYGSIAHEANVLGLGALEVDQSGSSHKRNIGGWKSPKQNEYIIHVRLSARFFILLP